MTLDSSAEPGEVPEVPVVFAQSSGFVTSGSGLAASEEGVITVMLSAVLGGLCGLLGGFMIAQISRYLSFLTGRHLWVGRWVLIGAVGGAVAFGIKAWLAGRD